MTFSILAVCYEEAILTKSKLGGAILIDAQGYRYCKIRAGPKKVFWRCVYYRKETGSCPAKAQTQGFVINAKSHSHPHDPDKPIIAKPHGNWGKARPRPKE